MRRVSTSQSRVGSNFCDLRTVRSVSASPAVSVAASGAIFIITCFLIESLILLTQNAPVLPRLYRGAKSVSETERFNSLLYISNVSVLSAHPHLQLRNAVRRRSAMAAHRELGGVVFAATSDSPADARHLWPRGGWPAGQQAVCPHGKGTRTCFRAPPMTASRFTVLPVSANLTCTAGPAPSRLHRRPAQPAPCGPAPAPRWGFNSPTCRSHRQHFQ